MPNATPALDVRLPAPLPPPPLAQRLVAAVTVLPTAGAGGAAAVWQLRIAHHFSALQSDPDSSMDHLDAAVREFAHRGVALALAATTLLLGLALLLLARRSTVRAGVVLGRVVLVPLALVGAVGLAAMARSGVWDPGWLRFEVVVLVAAAVTAAAAVWHWATRQ